MSSPFRQYVPGQIITEPGAYLGMPMEVYHGQPCDGLSVSSSNLRTVYIESPKHYWNGSHFNPNRKEFKQTEPIILGRAAHHLLLGEGDFGKYFAMRPDKAPDGREWHGSNKSCLQWEADRALEGLTIIKGEQIEWIRGMSVSLAAEPIVRGGILNGYTEVSMFWKDEETGIWLKSRPDNIPNDSGDSADLKCVADVSSDGISRALGERGYNQQAAMVREGMKKTLDIEMQHFTLVYVEQKPPHCVRFDEIHPLDIVGGKDPFTGEIIVGGHDENHAALRLIKRCVERNEWPGPKAPAGDGAFVRRTEWARKQSKRRYDLITQELAA